MNQDNTPAWAAVLPDWPGLPRLDSRVRADVCVIGLGGSGLAAIRRLQELGVSVAGVDSGAVAGAAAGRNGGLLLAGTAAFHHDAERELGKEAAREWYLATMDEVERMLAETPELATRTGSLRIACDEAELADCRLQLAAMRAAELKVEEYAGPEGEGLVFPLDAVFNPLGRCRELARRALADGARLFEYSPVTAIERGLVTTGAGSVACSSVIVAVDGNLALLLPELAGDVKPLRLQMLATVPTAEVQLTRPVYYRSGLEYWQQLPDGRVLLGGFRDRGGPAEWSGQVAVPGGVVQIELEAFLREHLKITAAISHRWAATVGYRTEVLPRFGEVRDGVWALGGYNGTGNVMGSLLGRRTADEVTAAG